MSLKKIGDAVARCIADDGYKSYVQIGIAFVNEDGNTVIKMNATPLPHMGWNGFVYIFLEENNKKPKEVKRKTVPIRSTNPEDYADDDIPF